MHSIVNQLNLNKFQKYPCLPHGKHPDQAHLWMTVGKKKLIHSLRVWQKPGNIYNFFYNPFYSPHLLCSKKETSIQTLSMMVLWDTGPKSSWSAGFLNSCYYFPQYFISPSMACCMANSMNLDSVTNLGELARSLAACGQPAPVGKFSGKVLAATRTFPEDLRSKIP